MSAPLLLYMHIPFCTAKCTFCDWVTEVPTNDLRLDSTAPRRRDYFEAVAEQVAALAPRLDESGYQPRIMYWGGGTASILEEHEARRLMDALRSGFDLEGLQEATLEASPETVDPRSLAMFRSLGFARISIGLQSLDDRRLHQIGRRHDARSGMASVTQARAAGFDNINVDLISGFPGETLVEFDASVERALELGVNHVSLYPYRPALGTGMRRTIRDGRGGEIDVAEQRDAYDRGREMLQAAGLVEYGLSHFGSPPCASDLAYFRLGMDWIGFGSGATSLIGQEFLRTRPGRLSDFLAAPTMFDDRMPARTGSLLTRFLYQALSTFEGVDPHAWQERTGLSLAETEEVPEVAGFLANLRRYSDLLREDSGLRLPRDSIAPAYINMLADTAPHQAGARRAQTQQLLGTY